MRVSGPTYGPVLTSIAVVSAVLVLAAARGEGGLPTGLLASRPARWVGRRSYGIYLWNASLIAAVPPAWKPHVLLAILAAAASFGVAELSWRFVESPALRRKQRFARARSEVASVDVVHKKGEQLPTSPREPVVDAAPFATTFDQPGAVQ
jgi:peptidoglycan/LPS O-acetylase OafA/YrhL